MEAELPIFQEMFKEFFRKALQVIIESRLPLLEGTSSSSSFPSSRRKKEKKSSNLICNCDDQTQESLVDDATRPFILDVYLIQDPEDVAAKEILIERWLLDYVSSTNVLAIPVATVYKHIRLLLRCIYSTTRLLPAYSLFRRLSKWPQTARRFLLCKILRSKPVQTRENCTSKFTFSPVKTQRGKVGASVSFSASIDMPQCVCEDGRKREMKSFHLIEDYVSIDRPGVESVKSVQVVVDRRESWGEKSNKLLQCLSQKKISGSGLPLFHSLEFPSLDRCKSWASPSLIKSTKSAVHETFDSNLHQLNKKPEFCRDDTVKSESQAKRLSGFESFSTKADTLHCIETEGLNYSPSSRCKSEKIHRKEAQMVSVGELLDTLNVTLGISIRATSIRNVQKKRLSVAMQELAGFVSLKQHLLSEASF